MDELQITTTKPRLFRAASICMGDDECRHYLRGVFVQPCQHGGIVIIGTDGRTMSVGHDPNGSISGGRQAGAAIITLSDARLWDHFADSGHATVTGNVGQLYHHKDGPAFMSMFIDVIDFDYPNWRKAIAGMSLIGEACSPPIDPRITSVIGEAAKAAVGLCAPTPMTMFSTDPEMPALVRVGGVDDWFGLVMPMIVGKPPARELPSWMIA